MSRRIGLSPKGTPIKKPSKKIVFITGCVRPNPIQLRLAAEAVKMAMDHSCVILTSDLDGIDAEVIRVTNKAKYRKIVVWGSYNNVRYATNYGHNEIAAYGPDQRDAICTARSGSMITVGNNKRLKAMLKFGGNLGHSLFIK